MPIIDSQVHAYEAPKRPGTACRTGRPTSPATRWSPRWTAWASNGAIFISAFFRSTGTTRAMLEVQHKHPGHFAIMKPVDPADPAVGEVIAEWTHHAHVRCRPPKRPGPASRRGKRL